MILQDHDMAWAPCEAHTKCKFALGRSQCLIAIWTPHPGRISLAGDSCDKSPSGPNYGVGAAIETQVLTEQPKAGVLPPPGKAVIQEKE
jgi:hypothetical protein